MVSSVLSKLIVAALVATSVLSSETETTLTTTYKESWNNQISKVTVERVMADITQQLKEPKGNRDLIYEAMNDASAKVPIKMGKAKPAVTHLSAAKIQNSNLDSNLRGAHEETYATFEVDRKVKQSKLETDSFMKTIVQSIVDNPITVHDHASKSLEEITYNSFWLGTVSYNSGICSASSILENSAVMVGCQSYANQEGSSSAITYMGTTYLSYYLYVSSECNQGKLILYMQPHCQGETIYVYGAVSFDTTCNSGSSGGFNDDNYIPNIPWTDDDKFWTTNFPTETPTEMPTEENLPSADPTPLPSATPTTTSDPTPFPSMIPTNIPTGTTNPTEIPTERPTFYNSFVYSLESSRKTCSWDAPGSLLMSPYVSQMTYDDDVCVQGDNATMVGEYYWTAACTADNPIPGQSAMYAQNNDGIYKYVFQGNDLCTSTFGEPIAYLLGSTSTCEVSDDDNFDDIADDYYKYNVTTRKYSKYGFTNATYYSDLIWLTYGYQSGSCSTDEITQIAAEPLTVCLPWNGGKDDDDQTAPVGVLSYWYVATTDCLDWQTQYFSSTDCSGDIVGTQNIYMGDSINTCMPSQKSVQFNSYGDDDDIDSSSVNIITNGNGYGLIITDDGLTMLSAVEPGIMNTCGTAGQNWAQDLSGSAWAEMTYYAPSKTCDNGIKSSNFFSADCTTIYDTQEVSYQINNNNGNLEASLYIGEGCEGDVPMLTTFLSGMGCYPWSTSTDAGSIYGGYYTTSDDYGLDLNNGGIVFGVIVLPILIFLCCVGFGIYYFMNKKGDLDFSTNPPKESELSETRNPM